MPKKINLLPTRHPEVAEVPRLRRLLRLFIISTLALSIFLGVLGLGIIFFLSNQLKNLSREQADLKTSISSLESAEQSLVLVKDRIQKIQEFLSINQDLENLSKQRFVVNSLPSEILIKKAFINQDGSTVELISPSSVAVRELFSTLIKNQQFSSLLLEELKFNPVLGYQFSLSFQ